MSGKALNLLGLMRKANAVMIGETDTGAAVRGQSAKLVLLASDASDNARSRAKGFVYGRNIPLITVPFTKEEISDRVGKAGCSMAAICDIGFANAFMQELCEVDNEKFSGTAELVGTAYEKHRRLKQECRTHELNRKNGKRRKIQ
ncbi:MAG: ribosomal L7Ae/L30e/S12e/Gadd45 family protein [Oscillospiraceae bacterium]|nr:ribosomal L7Ae/L30e/S12e/Gadd45 family protein [Oscillospiraceae bacterium]